MRLLLLHHQTRKMVKLPHPVQFFEAPAVGDVIQFDCPIGDEIAIRWRVDDREWFDRGQALKLTISPLKEPHRGQDTDQAVDAG